MVAKRLVRWLDDRLGTSRFTRSSLNKVFPDHWSFMLGEIALYCFVVLVLTGVFLIFFFDASTAEATYEGSYQPLRAERVSAAFKSVVELSFDVRAGLLMRQIHHWAALVFAAAVVAHLCRIFFTGAFRRPREINWMVGVTLLMLVLFNGFTGYSLPDDLLSGTGLRIAYSVVLSIPVVGTWVAFLVFGGEFPADQIIGRLYAMHILIVPLVIAGLLAVHLAVIWRQHHTQFPGPGRAETRLVGSKLWPTYTAKSTALFFAVFAVLGGLGGVVQINPVWAYGPFEPDQVTSPAQPDWYVGWVEGALRLFPSWELQAFGYTVANPFYPAVLMPGLTFLALYAWPFLEARLAGDHQPHHLLDGPRDHPVRTAIGVAALSFYGVLLLAGSNDLIASRLHVDVASVTLVLQIFVLGLPPVAGYTAYRLANALAGSGAERFSEMPLQALWRRAQRGEGGATTQTRPD